MNKIEQSYFSRKFGDPLTRRRIYTGAFLALVIAGIFFSGHFPEQEFGR